MNSWARINVAELCFATVAMLATTPALCGSIDGIFIAPPEVAPSYESDAAAEARLRGLENTPEADARPGEYYFLEGAHAFRRHQYTFAIQMYQVSASWAYKPAEYNIGVMYARGQGVEVDLPRAMAWMALAAERNEPHYVDAREAVYASITKEQFEQANVIWRELKKTYGDEVALRRAKARWAEVRSRMTGSRVGSIGNLSVGTSAPGAGVSQGPKLAPDIAKAAERGRETIHGFKTPAEVDRDVRSAAYGGPQSSAEVLGGQGIDGSVAYRQLRESDNPYDPKFRHANGTTIVGPPATIDPNAKPAADPKPADTTDASDSGQNRR